LSQEETESGQKPKEPGKRTPEEIAKEWVERSKKEKVVGALPLPSQIEAARYLWGVQGLERRQISTILHLSLPIINDACDGILQGKPPGGPNQQEIEEYLADLGLAVEKPKKKEEVLVVTSPAAPSQKALSSIYALAIQKGFETMDDFIFRELIPWYGVKMEWEFRAHKRISPEDFLVFLDEVTRKSLKFDELAQFALREGVRVE
jgi:hypothetical protein